MEMAANSEFARNRLIALGLKETRSPVLLLVVASMRFLLTTAEEN
jgi:hypothetical protein